MMEATLFCNGVPVTKIELEIMPEFLLWNNRLFVASMIERPDVHHFYERAVHRMSTKGRDRYSELLEANNALLERARTAEAQVEALTQANLAQAALGARMLPNAGRAEDFDATGQPAPYKPADGQW
jgi:hypothetical protein